MKLSQIASPFALVIVSMLVGCRTTNDSAVKDASSGTRDAADTNCQVVLREAGQSTLGGGEVFKDSNRRSWIVYRGIIDVSTKAINAGATVAVQYAPNNSETWTTVAAVQSADPAKGLERLNGGKVVPPGFTRLAFATTSGSAEAGVSHIGVIRLIPFLIRSDGTRVFDHNRVSDNYLLSDQNGAKVLDDFSICKVAGNQ